MAGTPGVAAKVFGSLADAGVNVRAIAQGSSERNISLVIESKQAARALRSVHAGFYLSPHTVSIGLIGPGTSAASSSISSLSQRDRLQRDRNLDLRLRGIITSSRMVLAATVDRAGRLAAALGEGRAGRSVSDSWSTSTPTTCRTPCSSTASRATRSPSAIRDWLAAGIHVVTPNKRASSADLALYERLQEARRAGGSHFLYEATVGAGLPIIQTLRDLRETGDEIRRIEGILSGTLSYLFNVWDGQQPFSSVVRDARQRGLYRTRSSRRPLGNGRRTQAGHPWQRDGTAARRWTDVRARSRWCRRRSIACSADEFLDASWRARRGDADAAEVGTRAKPRAPVCRRRSTPTVGSASVGVVELDRSHPFAQHQPHRQRRSIRHRPIRRESAGRPGTGAGPAVTAAGVFANLLQVCAYVGTHL